MGGTIRRLERAFLPKDCLDGSIGMVRCRPLGSGKKVDFCLDGI